MADAAFSPEIRKTVDLVTSSSDAASRVGIVSECGDAFTVDDSTRGPGRNVPCRTEVNDSSFCETVESAVSGQLRDEPTENKESTQPTEETNGVSVSESRNLQCASNEEISLVPESCSETVDSNVTVDRTLGTPQCEKPTSSGEELNLPLYSPDSEWDTSAQSDTDESREKHWPSFASFLSLFQVIKASNSPSPKVTKNNESKVEELTSAIPYQNNFLNKGLACCPFGSPYAEENIIQPVKWEPVVSHSKKMTVVNISPKPKCSDPTQFVQSSESLKHASSLSSTPGSSLEEASSSGEATSPVMESQFSPLGGISSQNNHSGGKCGNYRESNSIYDLVDIQRPFLYPININAYKLKLIHEGDVSVSFMNHSKTNIGRVFVSKFLKSWETHHIYLEEDGISSKTPSGILKSPISYSSIEDVYTVGRWEHTSQHSLRLVLTNGSILFQANSPVARDQWLLSILWKRNMHKCRNILHNSTRPEVILKEIGNLVNYVVQSPLQDDSIISVPVQIISNVLMEKEIWTDRDRRENLILALVPLLEKTTPSPEMFQFFSQHCLLNPRSQVIIDVFTSVVQQILKRTYDFGKSPFMGKFVADYMTALHSQNDGDEVIRKFLLSLHGPNFECPHPRVLQNLVAVTLAAIFSHFEQKRTLSMESSNEETYSQAVHELDRQLKCHTIVFQAVSEFEDWRPGLAQLLQPIPFPDDALSYEFFMEGLTPVIKSIGTDKRCEVHEMVLGVREDTGGWLNVYCPSGLVCKDEGELWCQMLETLISCCCRRKSFLQKMMKHLGALILVALRGHDIAQEILCLMLEWRIINGEEQEMQVVTALESTGKGREKYAELCKRQEHLRQLQKKRGPRKLTLPSRSTDVDVAQLLSSGSFGNLEYLSLAFTHVTSSCAYQLIQLPTLRCLNLWATHFGDAGLEVIAEHLDKLQVLNLCETPVTDKGISALASMKNLKKLNLNSTKLSPQTLETLKQKLPALQELDVRYTDAW